MTPAPAPVLPAPGVRFAPDFVRRLERLVLRLSAARERREGAGGAALAGGGEEFVGYRPYRSGEDLRQLDWNLFARLDRPYVRVTRREASEEWAVLVDTSGSMGVGPPGKLQAAAEAACAFACTGLRMGARVRVVVSADASGGGAGGPATLQVRNKRDLPLLLAFLEAQRAGGDRGLASLIAARGPGRHQGRIFLVGDLLDLEERDVLGLLTGRRELFALQLLAPVEVAPSVGAPMGAAVEWLDPEGTGRRSLRLDAATVAAYERALEARLEHWGQLAARHGFSYGLYRSDQPFEDIVRGVLGV